MIVYNMTYYIHDNGGRPFKVVIDDGYVEIGAIDSQKFNNLVTCVSGKCGKDGKDGKDGEENNTITYTNFLSYHPKKIFIGKSKKK